MIRLKVMIRPTVMIRPKVMISHSRGPPVRRCGVPEQHDRLIRESRLTHSRL